MPKQIINTSTPNSGRGDSLFSAFTKINANFSALFTSFRGWKIITGDYTAENGDRIIANTANGSFTITLPSTPQEGFYIEIADGFDFSVNNLLLTSVRPVEGFNEDIIFDIKGLSLEFVYVGTSWQILTTLGVQGPKGDSADLLTVAAPLSSQGAEGDRQGMIAFDNQYFYYCLQDFDGITDIWKRIAWGNDNWSN